MHKRISFAEPERLSEIFDAEHREEWQNTSHILATLNLSTNEVIADVGAGTGYFSAQFADKAGKVFAIDAEANMVSYMNKRFEQEGRNNIETRQCTLTDPRLPEDVDVVFLANTYRFIEDRPAFLSNLYRQTNDSVKIMFVDLRKSNARVSTQMARDEVIAAGFQIGALDESGCPDHYIMTFSKV